MRLREPGLLQGAIDLHLHSAPDCIPRYDHCVAIAREAAEAGFRAIVFKDHFSPSVVKAELTQSLVPEIRVFGGVALNHLTGGLNPRTVAWALRTGARVIMMPTMDSLFMASYGSRSMHYQMFQFGYRQPPIPVLEEGGRTLRPEAEDILRLVAEADAVLATGHLGQGEALALCRRARELGVRRMMVTHPNHYYPFEFTLEGLKELTSLGAYLNLSFGACHPYYGRHDPREVAEIVRHVGPERCNLITDFGQLESPAPAEGMRVFCEILMKCGFDREAIDQMVKVNPARLLGLEEL